MGTRSFPYCAGSQRAAGRMSIMENPDILVLANQWCEILLIWVGFGTLTGLSAKAIMPGRDPGGAVATLGMGISGTLVGMGILTYFYNGEPLSPISPIGF